MSWQEELRKLDEELASGRLSADDYRVRRDQVLSSAVGQADAPGGPPPGQPPQNPDATQVIPPVSPPQGVPQQQPDNSAERTQAVPQWQPQQPQQPGDADRTQYVQPSQAPYSPAGGFPQAGPASPPGGFPQSGPASPPGGFQSQQPWNAPDSDQTPPWGGGDLPPLGPTGDAGWVQQGPESFDDKPRKGNGTKIAAIVGAVIVLAGVALGAYLLWGRDSGGGGTDQTTAAQPPASQAPASSQAPDPLAVADLPGGAENHQDITSFGQVPGLTYLNSSELEIYQTAQAGDVKYIVRHLDDGNRVTMLLVQVNSSVAAQNAANQLLSIQVRNGGTQLSSVPNGVYASANDKQKQVRGHYAHDNVIVRIEVVSDTSLQSAQSDFASIVASQLQTLPADG